ncbi:hypothetical protein F4821DRAFT_265222 [Hypoxylon rubiginosum]|uniref:Uncharacterized protein n=1 Tax=Hypoxylon rubiginosum TaxID=110542 RepID=A0ACC0CL81_9PEZI|nr:hypothetical protein F4821DRAFT_265222 [Hypoxylon rubiginosum]
MCRARNIYFSCLHEDMNVTPPHPLAPCDEAILRDTGSGPVFCVSSFHGWKSVRDKDEDIIRERPCTRCYIKELREALWKDWVTFINENAQLTTTGDMLFYMEQRDNLFKDPDVHYWNLEQKHRSLVKKCLDDIQAKYGPPVYEEAVYKEEEADFLSSESSTPKRRHFLPAQ